MLKKYDELKKELLSYGLTNGSALGLHMGIIICGVKPLALAMGI